MYTQNFDQKQHRKYKKRNNQKPYSRKRYFLRKSKAKKPRFTDYNYTTKRNLDDDETESNIETESEFMNIEVLQEGYEVDIAIEKAEKLADEYKNITFKCKGCQKDDMKINECIEHFRNCLKRKDNLGYRNNEFFYNKIEFVPMSLRLLRVGSKM